MEKFNNATDCIWVNDYYYVLKSKNIIEVYDNDLNCVRNVNLNIECSSITYDTNEKFFYLNQLNNIKQIYKTKNFENFVPVDIPTNCLEIIKNLSYCKCYNALLITTEKSVYMFYLKRNCIKVIYKVKEQHTSVNSCIEPLGSNKCKKTILIGAICCCKNIYIAYRTGETSFISKISKENQDEVVYKTANLIKAIFTVNEFIYLLVIENCNQKIICTGIDCVCDCNEVNDCKCQIIESIATIEKSISKILSSEALKIKVVIDKTDDINDLICVNSSVKDVIYYVTILEFILTEKLKVVNQNDDCE